MNLYLSKDNSALLKGFAIILILLGHLGIAPTAYYGVAIFLIVSGYGLYISFEKNGLNCFFRKRLFKVLIPYWIVTILWILIDYILELNVYSKKELLFSFLGFFNKIDVTMWFISFIIFWYVCFWATFRISKRK